VKPSNGLEPLTPSLPSDGSDRESRIMAFTARGRCSECARGRLPLPEALRDELSPLLLAPPVQHLAGAKVDACTLGVRGDGRR
jgi:hypothetical protein